MAKNVEKMIDSTDQKILEELVLNSNRSYRELSRELSISPAALIERIKYLEAAGYILGYGARLNYSPLGFDFMAIVNINISSKNLPDVEDKIASIPRVAAVWDTTGEYDAMVVLMCKSRSELSTTVKKILGIEGVEKTNTNIVLNVIKRLTEFNEV